MSDAAMNAEEKEAFHRAAEAKIRTFSRALRGCCALVSAFHPLRTLAACR